MRKLPQKKFYFVHCNNLVLKDVNRACYCTCFLVALLVPEICFWLPKTRKNLNFLRGIHVFNLVFKFCSDIKEKKLATASLFTSLY